MMAEGSRVTSELLWRGTAIAALIDIPLVLLVVHFVSGELFRRLKWRLAAAAFLIYTAIWGGLGSWYFWDSVYSAVFPFWSRWVLPLWFGFVFGLLALLFWRISLALGKWEPVWFVLLGGLVSLVGHGIGIARGLLRVPLLSEASAASALVFGVFEFIVYWSWIVLLAAGMGHIGAGLRRTPA
jgi:hypothetical protein